MRTARFIRRFIEDVLLEEPYDGSDPLADEMLDSLAVEQLIAGLEERYGITFDDSDAVAENFSSVKVLAALVDAKRRSAKRRIRDTAAS